MKAVSIVKFLFTLIGLGLCAGAVFLYDDTRSFLAEAQQTEGTVIDLQVSRSSDSYTYRPVVRFTTPGGEAMEFVSSVGSNPPSYDRGETVDILYLPNSPRDARIGDFFSLWGAPLILGVLGSVFFLTGFGIILGTALGARKRERLRAGGRRIQTDFLEVARNTNIRINGRHPYQILTQWQNPMTGEIHVFKSENLYFDPSDYIKDGLITVFVNGDDLKNYYVDVSFLPKLAG